MNIAVNTYMKVANSFVHASASKVTSLTICIPKDEKERFIQFTFSDKKNPIRVKMNPEEIAGLAKALESGKPWSTFHSFDKNGSKMETRVQLNNSFINAERAGNKIALKLTENEQASLELTLKALFTEIVTNRATG